MKCQVVLDIYCSVAAGQRRTWQWDIEWTKMQVSSSVAGIHFVFLLNYEEPQIRKWQGEVQRNEVEEPMVTLSPVPSTSHAGESDDTGSDCEVEIVGSSGVCETGQPSWLEDRKRDGFKGNVTEGEVGQKVFTQKRTVTVTKRRHPKWSQRTNPL